MATDLYKQLYQGQLPSSVGTLFTVTTGHSFIIKHIVVVNNDTSDRTFQLFRGGTAAANAITGATFLVKANGGMQEWDGTITMDDGETLRAVASAASQLTITIDGDDYTK